MLRAADVLVYNWINGKHACVDLTCCSPLAGFEGGFFDKEKGLKNLVRKKYDKHDKADVLVYNIPDIDPTQQ